MLRVKGFWRHCCGEPMANGSGHGDRHWVADAGAVVFGSAHAEQGASDAYSDHSGRRQELERVNGSVDLTARFNYFRVFGAKTESDGACGQGIGRGDLDLGHGEFAVADLASNEVHGGIADKASDEGRWLGGRKSRWGCRLAGRCPSP